MSSETIKTYQKKASVEFIDILFYVSAVIISIGTFVFINQTLNLFIRLSITTFIAIIPLLFVLFVKFRKIEQFYRLANPLLLVHVLVGTATLYAWYEPINALSLMFFERDLLYIYYILFASLILGAWFWFLSKVLNGNQILIYFTIITLPVTYISFIQSYLELLQSWLGIIYPFLDSRYHHFYSFFVLTIGLVIFSISNYLLNLGEKFRILTYFVRISGLVAIYFTFVSFTAYFAYNDLLHFFLLIFNYIMVLFFFYYFNRIRAVDGYILASLYLVGLINYSIFYLVYEFDLMFGRDYIGPLLFIASGVSLLIVSVVGYYFWNKDKNAINIESNVSN